MLISNHKINLKHCIQMLVVALLCVATSSCSLWHEDLDPCAVKPKTYTRIKFKYDYNTSDVDKFMDEIGGVTLYVFDADNHLVAIEERTNKSTGNALKYSDFMVEFDSETVRPGERYSFYAVAHGHENGYDGAIAMPGSQFRKNMLTVGVSTPNDFFMMLDRDAEFCVNHGGVIIDHLYLTRQPEILDIPEEKEPAEGDPQEPDHIIEATIHLMRVTNYLTVRFWETDFPGAIDPNNYQLRISSASGHGRLDFIGKPMENITINHVPVMMTTETATIDGVVTKCVCARFGLSRLMTNDDMTLRVLDKANGRELTLRSLPALLSNGNDAFAPKKWSAQEYLDRECEYSIDFPLGGDVPKWVQLNVNILSWTKRIQLENL